MKGAPRTRDRDERGDTLIEVLVAIVIVGLTSVSLLGAFLISIAGSSEHKGYATIDTVLRSFAGEVTYQVQLSPQVPTPTFVECATPLTYQIVQPYPADASPGSSVEVFATGFTSGKPVGITIGGVSVTSRITGGGVVTSKGTISAQVSLPASGLALGANPIVVSDGTKSGTGTITITSDPAVTTILTNYAVSISSVKYWNGTAFTATCTQGGNAAQLVTITATSPTSTGSSGTDSVSVVVANPVRIATAAPVITSANTATFTAGIAGSATIQAGGTPTPNFNESGALPSGVTFSDNNNGTATLAGTPVAGTSGSYSFTITASNGTAPNAVQSFTLTVDGPPSITSASSYAATTSSAFSFTVTTAANPRAALTETGALPSNVKFVDNGDGTGTLSGTPGAATAGSYPISFTANNGISPNAVQSFTLTVSQPPAITSAAGATFTVGTKGTFTVTTTGSPKSALSETGALPGAVKFVDNGNGTATISGVPASGTGDTYAIVITATNGASPSATQNFTLTVDSAPLFTSANSAYFVSGNSSSFMVTTSGLPAASITYSIVTGALPSGVTFTPGTGMLAGKPKKNTSGQCTIQFTASNGIAPSATQTFTFTWGAAQ